MNKEASIKSRPCNCVYRASCHNGIGQATTQLYLIDQPGKNGKSSQAKLIAALEVANKEELFIIMTSRKARFNKTKIDLQM